MHQQVLDQKTRIDGLSYLRVLRRMHAKLNPDWYLEIGTFRGRSLGTAACNTVSVDPNFQLTTPPEIAPGCELHLIQKTSDDFFASDFIERNGIAFDLAFLDGLHHYEVLLRDVINTEKAMNGVGAIALHDCCPTSVEMTSRERTPGEWTGDVWKTLLILKKFRPDLDIAVLSAAPTGLVVLRNLDPDSTVLRDKYDSIIAEFDQTRIEDFDGRLDGYYDLFDLAEPHDFLSLL